MEDGESPGRDQGEIDFVGTRESETGDWDETKGSGLYTVPIHKVTLPSGTLVSGRDKTSDDIGVGDPGPCLLYELLLDALLTYLDPRMRKR